MNNIERLFILTGIVFLLIGMSLGLHMSMSQDFTLSPLHAHLNLLGFVLMCIFGICYHTWPAMKDGPLCKVHYVLHTVVTAVSLSLLYFVLKDGATYGPTLGPILDITLIGAIIGVLIFGYLFFTRAKS